MNWIILVLTTAVFYGFYHFLVKVSSNQINQIVGAVILQFVGLLVGLVGLIAFKINIFQQHPSAKGIIYSVLAGLAVGMAEILSFYTFSKNVSLSLAAPIIIGGSMLISIILGYLLLHESINLVQAGAIVMILIGVVVLLK